ncbi:CRISPR-associated endonuclease Cas1 [Thiocapsa imhoffii]|uniref:CRISPR-associated endonuclease Cas1 n=1 Tax=Thiocapsa imhoffii TaxID=382777 RepID=A0A9X0WIQ7_9GAMM|nr:CRISPR-associated endonuclease Cas1 [Thiocapsa imhoffii]MBK1645235.1 CRISPR-associated endonuclease Cas1 [Thiocapsa imhoffii]
MILVIDRRATRLRHDQGLICVEQDAATTRRVPIQPLELVVVYGNPLVETTVWRKLAAAGVPTVLLPTRSADPPTWLGASLATQLPLRRLQHRCASNPVQALAIARWLIAGKLAGYDLPLAALQQRHQADPDACRAFLQRRDQALVTLAAVTTNDAALGIEGQVAQAWFGLLAASLAPTWQFRGRNRRPPRDPVNALLSLGYTLAAADIQQVALSAGLDPSFGFLHQPAPGRESMILDLTELFRAAVDHFVLSWINPAGPERSDWFYREEDGCRLSKSARPAFYQAWADVRRHWPYSTRSDPDQPWPTNPVTEQVRGVIERLRAELKALEAMA